MTWSRLHTENYCFAQISDIHYLSRTKLQRHKTGAHNYTHTYTRVRIFIYKRNFDLRILKIIRYFALYSLKFKVSCYRCMIIRSRCNNNCWQQLPVFFFAACLIKKKKEKQIKMKAHYIYSILYLTVI